uniref:UN2 n=1 Tax=Ehrlichia ewingii TaxID=947 RepID=B1N6A5_9RICK|nr:UN2 [Ehrlichia ewingii]
MSNRKLYNKSLLFSFPTSCLFLFFHHSSHVNALNFSISNYLNRYNNIFNTEDNKPLNSQVNTSFMFITRTIKSSARKTKGIVEDFCRNSNVLTKKLVPDLYTKTVRRIISIFNEIKLNHIISYLTAFTSFRMVTSQYHEVMSNFKGLFINCSLNIIDKRNFKSIISGINYFDREIRCLLSQSYNY